MIRPESPNAMGQGAAHQPQGHGFEPSQSLGSAVAAHLTRAWLRRGPLAWLLWPVSLLMTLLVRWRQGLYMSGLLSTHRMPVPVLVVGNVVAGGAGKTPAVMALVQHLQARGYRLAVISRGYGRKTSGAPLGLQAVLPHSTPSEVGDEPLLIQRRTGVPVWVGRDRVAVARALLAQHPQVNLLVCDDGLQHLALQRDIEVCVFDDRGVGNGWLLPAGPLREPWPRAVDVVLHTGQHPAFQGRQCFVGRRELGQAVQANGTSLPLKALNDLNDLSAATNEARARPVLALAGIAQPEAFFGMLRARGLTLARTLALPDHFNFERMDPNDYRGYTVVCTEKDAVKLWAKLPQAWAVPLQFTPEPRFFEAIDRLLAPPRDTH